MDYDNTEPELETEGNKSYKNINEILKNNSSTSGA